MCYCGLEVETSIGKRRQGQLESVDDERIRILMKFGSGEFTFPVKLEVLYKPKCICNVNYRVNIRMVLITRE